MAAASAGLGVSAVVAVADLSGVAVVEAAPKPGNAGGGVEAARALGASAGLLPGGGVARARAVAAALPNKPGGATGAAVKRLRRSRRQEGRRGGLAVWKSWRETDCVTLKRGG